MPRPDLRHLLDTPYAAARAAKADGRKVVGIVSNNVPVELIHAAGLFPVQLAPRPGPTPRADAYMEALFDPMLRSVFDQVLAGELDFLDAIVLPRAVDSLQRTYYYLCELRRTGVAQGPIPILYDVQKLPTPTSAEYTYRRTLDFQKALEALAARAIDGAALRQSIAAFNALRTQIVALGAARAQGKISGADAMRAMAIAPTLAPDVATSMLTDLLATPAEAQGEAVILIGSAHYAPDLHEAITEAGGQVVGDFHWRGDLFYGPAIDASADPLRAIADHYWRNSYSVRDYPAPLETLTAFARERRANAAIFFFNKEEEALVWDYPAQAQALQRAEVRILALTQQSYPAKIDAGVLREFFAGGAS